MSKNILAATSTTPPDDIDKQEAKKKLKKLKKRLEELQNLLFAEQKHSLLIILQGMDGSGKDGAIKNVFGATNPMGCRVYAFKRPNDTEMKHDFLWRIHQNVPPRGMIHIFNRSHYEDAVAQRVHHWIDTKVAEERFEHINNFEKLLLDSGTHILKFFLHISKDEQIKRLEERMSDPSKMWKYNDEDIKERQFWDQYEVAYSDAFRHCSGYAEWHIVPSDTNWYKEYYIAKQTVKLLESLNMKFPGLKTA